MYKKIKKTNTEICKEILDKIKKEKKNNSSYDLLKDPRMCFVLSKAILLFNDKHKQKTLAIELLKNLSEREFSQTFKSAKFSKR